MKLRVFLSVALMLAVLLVGVAQASYPTITSGLEDKVATRSGPSTGYNELGTFFPNTWYNTTVKALSRCYDNNIWWVQVEFSNGGSLYRAYTGEKRLSANTDSLPVEEKIATTTIRSSGSVTAYTGPGTNYKTTTYKVPASITVDVYDTENGYAQIDYLDSTRFRHRCWIPLSYLNWNGSDNYNHGGYVVPTATPVPYWYPTATPTPSPVPYWYPTATPAPTQVPYWYPTATPRPTPTQDPWSGWDDWSGTPFTGNVSFREGDMYVWTGGNDTGFTVTSNVDIRGCAMIELTVAGKITYLELELYMDSDTQGSFMTFDGREGVITFYDTYAMLDFDLSFAGMGNQFFLYKY